MKSSVLAAVLLCVPLSASAGGLIEIGTPHPTPFVTRASGEPVQAVPVRIHRYEDGTVEYERVPVRTTEGGFFDTLKSFGASASLG